MNMKSRNIDKFYVSTDDSEYTKLIKLPRVVQLTTLSPPSIYRLIKEGKVPSQIKISSRASAWIEQEVVDYVEGRINGRDFDQVASET